MTFNCYTKLYIPNFVEGRYEIEIVDLNYTDTSNVEGIIEYVKNVFKIKNFDLHLSILDFDHFKELMYGTD